MSAPKDQRALSFGSVADAYDRFRPPLPRSVAEFCGATAASSVVDLAAGTGLATRTFVDLGCTVTAVEPDAAMREVLTQRSPTVTALSGTAESLPLPDTSVDLVIVCSAWHWFDPIPASREIGRVLCDGGHLAIVWNGLDQRVDWVAAFARLRDAMAMSHNDQSRVGYSPAAVVVDEELFDQPVTTTISWSWERSAEDLVAMLATYSGVITADDVARAAVAHRGRELLADHVTSEGTVTMPMAARVWLGARRERPTR